MDVVRRSAVGAVAAGVLLLAGPAGAQEDPCAPGPDGRAPEMCQSEPVSEPAREETVDPCEGARPGEPGDGEVVDGGQGEGVAEGEPHPDGPGEDVPEEKPVDEPEPEPVPEDEPRPEPDAPTMVAPVSEDESVATPAPGTVEDDGVVCAYAGLPASAPDTAAGGQEAAPVLESATGARNAATAAGKLPRTGPYDQVLALAGVGSGLLILGAGVAAAGRRRARRA